MKCDGAMQVQREWTVTWVSMLCGITLSSSGPGLTHGFVTRCTCLFAILCRENTSNYLSNSGNLQQRPLKCFSKPKAMKQWAWRGFSSGICATGGVGIRVIRWSLRTMQHFQGLSSWNISVISVFDFLKFTQNFMFALCSSLRSIV